jgi:hypothetical protein
MRHLLILAISICYLNSNAQQVGINNPSPRATLHVTGSPTSTGTTDGIIPPQLTRAQLIAKTGYSTSHAGAVVYVTDLSGAVNAATREVQHIGLYSFDGTKWNPLQNKMLGFSATRNTAITAPALTYTTIVYPTEEFDTNNWYNTSTGVFQPTQPGYYYITASASVYDAQSYLRSICIFKNGSIFKTGSGGYTIGVAVAVSSLIYFNGTTDNIYISLYTTQNLSITPLSRETFFSAHFVGN